MNQTNPETNPKAAHGAAKAPFFGIPWSAVVWLGAVMRGGALKYGFFNYRETRIAASTYHDAIMRHFLLWADGEDYDQESGCPHLAHVMACCALYMDAEGLGMTTDDRNKTGTMQEILKQCALVSGKYEEQLLKDGRHLYRDKDREEIADRLFETYPLPKKATHEQVGSAAEHPSAPKAPVTGKTRY